MSQTVLASVISVSVQVIMTSLIGWLVHKLASVRAEFRGLMSEHALTLQMAKDNSEAIIQLNRRMRRIERSNG